MHAKVALGESFGDISTEYREKFVWDVIKETAIKDCIISNSGISSLSEVLERVKQDVEQQCLLSVFISCLLH
jgi:hypothetical protein